MSLPDETGRTNIHHPREMSELMRDSPDEIHTGDGYRRFENGETRDAEYILYVFQDCNYRCTMVRTPQRTQNSKPYIETSLSYFGDKLFSSHEIL